MVRMRGGSSRGSPRVVRDALSTHSSHPIFIECRFSYPTEHFFRGVLRGRINLTLLNFGFRLSGRMDTREHESRRIDMEIIAQSDQLRISGRGKEMG